MGSTVGELVPGTGGGRYMFTRRSGDETCNYTTDRLRLLRGIGRLGVFQFRDPPPLNLSSNKTLASL